MRIRKSPATSLTVEPVRSPNQPKRTFVVLCSIRFYSKCRDMELEVDFEHFESRQCVAPPPVSFIGICIYLSSSILVPPWNDGASTASINSDMELNSPVQTLNRIRHRVFYKLESQAGSVQAPIFHMSVEVRIFTINTKNFT